MFETSDLEGNATAGAKVLEGGAAATAASATTVKTPYNDIGYIPSPGKMCPTVIDKSQPIESMGSRLRDHTRIFDSDVRARSNSRRTLPGEGIASFLHRSRVLIF